MSFDRWSEKRKAWSEFIARHGTGPIDPLKFKEYARPADSPFHDDLKWNIKEITRDYYEKRCANLIIKYSTIFNTVSVAQRIQASKRMHLYVPASLKQKGINKKYAATADEIAKDEEQLQQVRAAIWSRLRRVVSDMYDFRSYLPEFAEIYAFLHPKAVASIVVKETVNK